MNIDSIITLISFLTISSQVLFILALPLLFIFKFAPLRRLLADRAIELILLISLVATSGSLFFSQVANFAPCELCWFQRIFMYPLVILFGLAWYRHEKLIIDYATPLVITGWLIALYHNYIYYQASQSTICSLNSHTSCIIPYFTRFGYISIPVMSLTAFSMIGLLLFIAKNND
ncbi:MAG: disulfide bond formation protein B [bacterium]